MITHTQYMSDSEKLHDAYYLQFATNETAAFVSDRIGLEKLRKSNDKYFNDIGIKRSQNGAGSWLWDFAPVNIEKMREAGCCSRNSFPSPASVTCTAKACARYLLKSAV